MTKTKLTERIGECAKDLKDELELTGKHLSAMYNCFKNYSVFALLLAPMYDLGVTVAINDSFEKKNRRECLHGIYDK